MIFDISSSVSVCLYVCDCVSGHKRSAPFVTLSAIPEHGRGGADADVTRRTSGRKRYRTSRLVDGEGTASMLEEEDEREGDGDTRGSSDSEYDGE